MHIRLYVNLIDKWQRSNWNSYREETSESQRWQSTSTPTHTSVNTRPSLKTIPDHITDVSTTSGLLRKQESFECPRDLTYLGAERTLTHMCRLWESLPGSPQVQNLPCPPVQHGVVLYELWLCCLFNTVFTYPVLSPTAALVSAATHHPLGGQGSSCSLAGLFGHHLYSHDAPLYTLPPWVLVMYSCACLPC